MEDEFGNRVHEVPFHEWVTQVKLAENLDETMVIVGECAGLSAVFRVDPSSLLRGWLRIETEHGYLYAQPRDEFNILDPDQGMGDEPTLVAVDYNG